MIAYGSIGLVGDYGSKSAIAKLVLPNMIVEDYTAQQTKLSAFAAAIKAAGLTACNVGDIASGQKSESLAERPAANVNIKEKLYYAWRTKNDSTVHRGTIPGVPKNATIWTEGSDGDELNGTARAALEAALASAYGVVAPDGVVVLWGRNKE